jgi:hypothetical protein
MSKFSGKNAIILINGYNLSTYASAFDVKEDAGKIPVQGFTDECENYIPGMKSASINATLFWDSTANTVHTALASRPNGHMTILPEGYALGNRTLSMPTMQGNYSPNGTPKGAIGVGNLVFESYGDNKAIEHGYALAHSTITDTAAGVGYQVNAAPVTASCVGTIHVWTPTVDDAYTVVIRHCTTLGGVYADLVTFTVDGKTRTSERVVVASGTINQFIKVTATLTGTDNEDFGFSVHFWQSV